MMMPQITMAKDIKKFLKKERVWCLCVWRVINTNVLFFGNFLADNFPNIKLENCEKANLIFYICFLEIVLLSTDNICFVK